MSSNTLLPDRSDLFARLSETEIVARYRAVWGPKVGIEEAKAQARLEGELTDRLLRSTPENRWAEFSDAYSRLFHELPWHSSDEKAEDLRDYRCWRALLGGAKKILEIGSGGGGLIRYLATQGLDCSGTEITQERGEKFVPRSEGVDWQTMDGVNLSHFVGENAFDAVLSDQVFEHLHPDDHLTHLTEARKILADGGRYILRAPHRSTGPRDLSEIFGLDKAVFLHLYEPDYAMMRDLCLQAGFDRVSAVFAIRRFGFAASSAAFLQAQIAFERIEAMVARSQDRKRLFRKFGKRLFVADAVWIVAEKSRRRKIGVQPPIRDRQTGDG